ncbi:MAG: nucleotidyltransferase domain-containing protein [Candidatus Thorarchaeota archaeon]
MNFKPIEGFFLVTKDDLIFEVKGNVHPKDCIVAYLRYVPAKTGDRLAIDGTKYRKIYDLLEREEYLEKNYPNYLWNDSVHGRVVQAVNSSDVAFVLNPVDFLRQLRDSGKHLSPLQGASLGLAEILVSNFDLSWDNLGLTGSQLTGLATLNSDIDLIVYGDSAGKKFYRGLRDDFDNIPEICRYSGSALDNHVDFRWSSSLQKDQLKEIEASKVLQGIYNSYEFFIRIVKLSEEVGYDYGNLKFEGHGSLSVHCRIVDDSEAIFTPCYYIVECEQHPKLTKLVSYRGRFTEQVKRGMIVGAKGRLEAVRSSEGNDLFLQLVMGESPDDFLIPIKK